MPDYIGPKARCGLCGERATGFAEVDGVRYCHGDDEPDPTCYMLASWSKSPLLGVPFHSLPERGADA